MDLNCITGEAAARGRAWGGRGGSKPGGGGTEMEFRFNREEDNPSLTVCRLSLPCFPPLRTLTHPAMVLSQRPRHDANVAPRKQRHVNGKFNCTATVLTCVCSLQVGETDNEITA